MSGQSVPPPPSFVLRIPFFPDLSSELRFLLPLSPAGPFFPADFCSNPPLKFFVPPFHSAVGWTHFLLNKNFCFVFFGPRLRGPQSVLFSSDPPRISPGLLITKPVSCPPPNSLRQLSCFFFSVPALVLPPPLCIHPYFLYLPPSERLWPFPPPNFLPYFFPFFPLSTPPFFPLPLST